MQIAERWIRSRMSRGRVVDPIVASALRQIDRDSGIISVTRFDDLNGRSRSRFGAAFRDQVGLTPKRYARVVRFRRALSLLQTGPSLSAVAAASGYYDQAHMTAEFRAHAGLTPRAYRNAERYPGSSNVIPPG